MSLINRHASFLGRILQKPEDPIDAMIAHDIMFGGVSDPEALSPMATQGRLGRVVGPKQEKFVSDRGAVRTLDGWVLPEDKRNLKTAKELKLFWVKVPHDLTSVAGGMPRLTVKGDPVETVSLAEEWEWGGEPTTVPVIYTLIPILAAIWLALTKLGAAVGGLLPHWGWLIAAITFVPLAFNLVILGAMALLFIALEEMFGMWNAVKSLLIGAVIPVVIAIAAGDSAGSSGSSALSGLSMFIHTCLVEAGFGSANRGVLVIIGAMVVLAIAAKLFIPSPAKISGSHGSMHSTKEKMMHAFWFAAYLGVLIWSDAFLPGIFHGALLFVPGCTMAMRHVEKYWRYRAEMLLLQNDFAQANRKIRSFNPDGPMQSARSNQVVTASRDTSPLIYMGLATGTIALKAATPFTPDKGGVIMVSCRDLSNNTIVFGAIGTGKTTTCARPVAFQYAQSGYGGLLVLCGKGQLPLDLRAIIRVMVEPGADYPIMAGLTGVQVGEIMKSFKATGKAVKESDDSGDGARWKEGAQAHASQCTTVHWALHRHEVTMRAYERAMIAKLQLEILDLELAALEGADTHVKIAKRKASLAHRQSQVAKDRTHRWTYANLYRTVKAANNPQKSGNGFSLSKEVISWLEYLGVPSDLIASGVPTKVTLEDQMVEKDDGLGGTITVKEDVVTHPFAQRLEKSPTSIHPEVHIPSSGLITALSALESWVVNQPEDTRNSFYSNIMQAFEPLMSTGDRMANQDRIPWIELEQGTMRIDGVFTGGTVGVALNPDILGPSALIITQIVRAATYSGIKRRDDDWANDPSQKPVLIMADEAHKLIGSDEANLITVGRSKGASFFFLTQGVENFTGLAGFEMDEVEAMLNQCGNRITLKSSKATYEYISSSIGTTLATKERVSGGGTLSFGAAWNRYRTSPLFDPSNASASWYQKLIRRGYGHVTVRPKSEQFSVHGGEHHMVDEDALSTYLLSLKMSRAKGEIEEVEVPMVSVEELQSLLPTKADGSAFVYLTRAGAPRYDFCKLAPMTAADVQAKKDERDRRNQDALAQAATHQSATGRM